jgi:hypothetical protein
MKSFYAFLNKYETRKTNKKPFAMERVFEKGSFSVADQGNKILNTFPFYFPFLAQKKFYK